MRDKTGADPGGHGARGGLALLDSPVRRSIVDLLANLPDSAGAATGLSAAQIGEHLGVHVTTARFHLDQLERHRLVESLFQHGRVGRPRKVYRTPRRPLPEPASAEEAWQALSSLLAESWKRGGRPTEGSEEGGSGAGLTPEQAGRRWALREAGRAEAPVPVQARTPGAWLAKVGMTMDLLRRWGYLPEVRTEDGGRTAELTLLDCPFLPLATEHADVVCGIHRGLLRGAMEAAGEPDTEVALQPLVGPRTCLARVSTRADLDA